MKNLGWKVSAILFGISQGLLIFIGTEGTKKMDRYGDMLNNHEHRISQIEGKLGIQTSNNQNTNDEKTAHLSQSGWPVVQYGTVSDGH